VIYIGKEVLLNQKKIHLVSLSFDFPLTTRFNYYHNNNYDYYEEIIFNTDKTCPDPT